MSYTDDDDDDSDIEAAMNKAHQKHISGGLRASTSSKYHCPTKDDDDDGDDSDSDSEDDNEVCKGIASSGSSSDDDDESSCQSSSYLTNRKNKKKGMTGTDQKMKKLNKLSRNKTQNVLQPIKPKKKLLDIIYCSSTDEDENDHKQGKEDDDSESEDGSIDVKNGKENDDAYVEAIDITNDKICITKSHRRVTRGMLKENNNQQVEMKPQVKTKKQPVVIPKKEVDDIDRDAMLLLESSSDEKDNDCRQLKRSTAASKRGRGKMTTKGRSKNYKKAKAALKKSMLDLIHNNDTIDVNTKLKILEAKIKLMEKNINDDDDDDEKLSICEATKISICEAKKRLMENINYDDENLLSQNSDVVIDEQHNGIQVKVYVTFINSFDGTTSSSNDNNNCSVIIIKSPDHTTVQMLIRSLLTIHHLKSSQVSVGCSYNGKVLNDYQTLSFYGITNNNSEIQATIFTSGNIGGSSSNNNNNTGSTVAIGKKIQLSLQVNEHNKNHNEKIKITIGMKQSIQILIDTYCIMKSIDNNSMKFTLKFDGETLDCTKTPTHYDIENDDQIDFIII